MMAFEQLESPPEFDAVALIDVEESSATSMVMPLPVKVDGAPVAAGVPEQLGFLKTFTRVGLPVPSVPVTSGWLSLAGELGLVPVSVGRDGGGGGMIEGSSRTILATDGTPAPLRMKSM